MIYKINFMSEEVDDFKLSFEASSEATFLELHKAILAAVGYPDDQMTSFFMCNDQWEKGQEVTLVEMGDSFEYDNMTMEQTHLSELLYEQKQRLLYVFDPMYDRCFFGSLSKINPGDMEGVKLLEKKRKAPEQLLKEDPTAKVTGSDMDLDTDFYGNDAYDEGDIDMEGFQDLSFDDGSMF